VKKQKTESQDTNTHTLNSNYLQSILSTNNNININNNNNINASTTASINSTKVSKKFEKHTSALKNTQKSDDNDEYINDKLYNDTNTVDDDSDTEYTVHTKKQTLKKPTTKRKRIEKDEDEDDDYCEYTTGNDAGSSNKEKNNKKDEMSSEKLSELTVAKLRDILKSYNLSTSGSKSLLISRIMEHQENSKSEKK